MVVAAADVMEMFEAVGVIELVEGSGVWCWADASMAGAPSLRMSREKVQTCVVHAEYGHVWTILTV